MARPRTKDKDLPPRCYRKHGAIYYVHPESKEWIRLGKTVSEAFAGLAKLIQPERLIEPLTVRELISTYLVDISPKKAGQSHADDLKSSKQLLPVLGDVRITDVTYPMLSQYIQMRTGKTRAQRERALLSSAMSYAVEMGWIDRNPLIGAVKRSVVGKTKSAARTAADAGLPQGIVCDRSYAAFNDFASPLVRAAAAISGATGLRQGDVLGLRRSGVLKDGLYTVIAKSAHWNSTRKPREVLFLWGPELRAAVNLALTCGGGGDFLLNPHPAREKERNRYDSSGFRSSWRHTMDACERELEWFQKFQFHDLRRSLGSFVTRSTGLGAVSEQLAHHSKTAAEHYARGVVVLPSVPSLLDNLRRIRQVQDSLST